MESEPDCSHEGEVEDALLVAAHETEAPAHTQHSLEEVNPANDTSSKVFSAVCYSDGQIGSPPSTTACTHRLRGKCSLSGGNTEGQW